MLPMPMPKPLGKKEGFDRVVRKEAPNQARNAQKIAMKIL
jgi:hypothetical protein